jgi:hypothetical protein
VYNTEIDVKISQIISLKYLFLGNVPVIDNLATTLILNYDDDVTKMPEDKSLTDNGLV